MSTETQSFTQSMAWLHRWAGLVLGWLLFAIFITGTLTVFDKEISWWMQPELEQSNFEVAAAAELAEQWAREQHPEAKLWNIRLPTAREPVLGIATAKGRNAPEQLLNPETGEPMKARDTQGGAFFFKFHYSFNWGKYPGAWIVGLAAMGMLVALVSALVIHKRIFKDFFLFRPFKGKRSWLDAHNVTGVLLLPFHIMITYTGLVIFVSIYMPAAISSLYEGGFRSMLQEGKVAEVAEAEAPKGALLPLADFVRQGEAYFGEGQLSRITVEHPNGPAPVVGLWPAMGSQMALVKGNHMHVAGADARILEPLAEWRGAAQTYQVMSGLHFAQFGGYPMRWLYFVCGVIGSAMIATGLVLYAMRLRRQASVNSLWLKIVESLNVTVMGGLPLACIAFLWVNHLLPATLMERAVWEVRVFFIVWLATLLHAWWQPCRVAWRGQLSVTAVLCLGLPLLGLFTVGDVHRHGLDSIRFGVEVGSVLIGLGLLWVRARLPRTEFKGAEHKEVCA